MFRGWRSPIGRRGGTGGLGKAVRGVVRGRAVVAFVAALVISSMLASPLGPSSRLPRAEAAPAARKGAAAVESRTASSRTVRNANGTFTTSFFPGRVNFRDDRGRWRPIDSTLGAADTRGYAAENRANSFRVLFKPRLAGDFLRLRVGGTAFGYGLDAARSAAGRAAGRRFSYPAVFEGVDLRYDVLARGVEETLVLANRDVPTRYRFRLAVPSGTTLSAKRLHDGSWAFVSPGRPGPLFVLDAPHVMETVAPGRLRKAPSDVATLDVRRAGSAFQLDLGLDARWLAAKDRRFPVLLDPTITIQPSDLDGNWITTCSDCTDFGTPMWVGTDGTDTYRASVRFDLSTLPPNANVTSASLGLWYDSDDCVPTSDYDPCGVLSHQLDVHRLTASWNTTDTTSAQIAYDPTLLGSYTVAAGAASGWMTWPVATTVQNWARETQPNYGFLVKRHTEPRDVGGPSIPGRDAYDPAQPPKLDVTFTGGGVRLDAPDTLHANGADLSWARWDPALGGSFASYEIHRSQGGDFTPSASTLVATIKDVGVTTYRDTTAAPSKTFSYKVVVNGYASNLRTVALPADGQATKTIQLGPSDSQETYAEYDSATTNCSNYGLQDSMFVGSDGDSTEGWKYRPLLDFDLRDIPAGAHVNSATLQLYRDLMPPAKTVTVGVYRATSAWSEGTGSWESPDLCTGDGATWSETQGGVKWKASGGDFDPASVASVSHTVNDVAGWDTFNVASAVQKWVDGTAPNLGLLLRFTDETALYGNWFTYYSDDYTDDPTLRPKLQLQYTDGSHTQAPSASVGAPGPGDNVGGTVALSAGASDDGKVTKVDFLVDGGIVSTDTTAPFAASWNSTAATNATHSLTAKAYDDAGNATTSAAVSVNVDNSAAPATSVTSPASGASVSGTPAVTASASDDRAVSHVEFYVDGNRFADLAAAPYSTTLPTTSSTEPVYDGAHTLTTKAYDAGGHVTTSSSVPITVANAPAGSQYKATFASTELPQAVTYDPALQTQDKAGVNVTVTNTSTLTWSTANVVLRYRWVSVDPGPVYVDGSDVALPAAVAPGGSQTVTVLVSPPALPDGVTRARYTLRFDLFDKVASAWFGDKGNQPLENPVIVNKALVRDALGLERYYHYVGREVGAGLQQLTNVANGNSILRWTPFDQPGRGLSTVLDLTYNALEKKCVCPAGNNWSLSISSLSRLGSPIDIHPNKADQIAGRSNKFIEFTDGDGTTHRFTDSNSDGYWEAPAGVHLYLRNYSTSDTSKWWAFTRPDRITFFYDQDGFPTSVADANGNTLAFTEVAPAPADDPGGPKLHVTKVTDAGGRSFDLAYYTKADAKKPQIRGKVKQITDHMGRALLFDYYFDGNLLRITQKGGTNPDGSFLADRSFVFTYTTSDGSGPAITTASARVNPDPGTSNESTRLYSVRDPRGKETLFSYLGPGAGTDRWKLASLTDRMGAQSTFAYDITNRITTVTEPLSRVSKYAYDTEGKVTKITNPLNQDTVVAWSADRAVSKVTEPTGVFTSYAYNDNGYLTSTTDQLGNQTQLTYDNSAVDANDVAAKWEPGRTIPHISDLATKTDPKGVATPTAGDYQWTFTHDAKGNVTSVTDPLGKRTTNVYNADGTLASTTDANGHVTSYPVYDNNGLPTTIVDPVGNATGDATNHRTTFTNDAAGELLSVQDPVHQAFGAASRSNASFFDYDPFGRMVRQSAPKSTAFEPGTLIWTSAALDPNDNVLSQTYPHYGTTTDPGGDKTTMTYDDMDRTTAQVVPHDPASTDPVQQSHRSTFVYDMAGRLTVQTDPKGTLSTSTDKDFATFFTYDLLDRVVAQTTYQVDGAGAIVETHKTQGCYDLAGDLRSVTAPKGAATFPGCPAASTPYTPLSGNYTTSHTYDAAHRTISTTDPLGRRSSLTYDANGDADSFTDGAGTKATRFYDQKRQLTKEVQPFRSGTGAKDLVTQYQYDAVGNLSKLISPRAYDASSDKQTFTQYVSSYEYDADDRLLRELLPTSSADTQQLYIHQAYDGNGRLSWSSLTTDQAAASAVAPSEKSQFSYFDTGWPRTTQDPAEPATSFDYTARGDQVARTRHGDTQTWTYFADGDLREEKDPHGDLTKYTYDANDNLATIDDAAGVQSADETPLDVQQTYDGFDRTVKTRQQKLGKPWHYTTFTYDLNDNVTNQEDDATENAGGTVTPGRRTDLFYNQVDQVIDQVDRGTQTGCPDDQRIQYTYVPTTDLQDQIVSRAGVGCTDAAPGWVVKQQTTNGYFLDGSVSTLKTWNGPSATASIVQSHTLTYEDPAGIYLNGNIATDSFTLASPVAGTPCQPGSPCTLNHVYDAKDRLIRYDNGRGGVTSYTLLPNSLLRTEAFNNSNGSTTKTYGYNASNGVQLSSLVRQSSSGTTTQRFFYDRANLICVTQDDATGSTRDDCTDPLGGTVSSRLRQSYSYDDLDRLTGAHGYLAGAQTDSGQWSYDALDRVSTEQETHTTGGVNRTQSLDYIGLSGDVAKEVWTGSDPTTKNYGYDAFGDKASLTNSPSGQSSANYLYGYNPHGDVSQLLDLTGKAASSYGYRPYGDEEAGTGAVSQGDAKPNSQINSYRYSAKRFDTGAGAINMGARFFSPDYGAFLQKDYLRDALGDLDLATDRLTNCRYGLAGGNPINYVEDDGHAATSISNSNVAKSTVPKCPSSYYHNDNVGSILPLFHVEMRVKQSDRQAIRYFFEFRYKKVNRLDAEFTEASAWGRDRNNIYRRLAFNSSFDRRFRRPPQIKPWYAHFTFWVKRGTILTIRVRTRFVAPIPIGPNEQWVGDRYTLRCRVPQLRRKRRG